LNYPFLFENVFDKSVSSLCSQSGGSGRPGMEPVVYLKMMMVGLPGRKQCRRAITMRALNARAVGVNLGNIKLNVAAAVNALACHIDRLAHNVLLISMGCGNGLVLIGDGSAVNDRKFQKRVAPKTFPVGAAVMREA
jgi:hypothetical protein